MSCIKKCFFNDKKYLLFFNEKGSVLVMKEANRKKVLRLKLRNHPVTKKKSS